MNELASWLMGLRRESKLSLAALSEKTKIMPKHLEALENGDFGSFPSKVHARAFATAFARACGADDDEMNERLSAAWPPQGPAQALAKAAKPAEPATALPNKFSRRPERVEPPAEAPEPLPPPEEPSTPLPWKLWGVVAASALAFLFLLHSAVSCVRGASGPKAGPAPAAQEAAASPLSATAEAPADDLELRSRRPCWVLLVIDGQRLPVVLLEPHKKESWKVRQKAVMLAGNIGAVRIWWRGDNLGYFGELGERMNGIVFENGKAWRRDVAEDLALPAGVPSQAQK